MGTPTFGIFDHIEDIPGTPTPKLLKDRLDLIKMADEAGFAGYHLAEHHGSDLCMAPNQEVFIAAATQITKNIRLGPMVKLLPLHHPVRIIEDLCVVDNLSNGRLDFGVGRGVAPIEHYWFGSNWPESTDRFVDTLGIICDAFATGEISSENSKYYDFPTIPMSTKPVQDPIPFWYPGSPVTAGRHGMNLMWPGPIGQAAHDLYVETWNAHRGDTHRVDGPNSAPRVGCTMVLAIAPTETEALDIARRGMTGLVRRAHNVHRHDNLVLDEVECDAALGPLRRIMEHIEGAIHAGAGTATQIKDRFAEILAPGLTDYIVLQIPTGDMTLEEAKRTMDVFCSDVKPALEAASHSK
jgi:alkanesulfonate monooxygenase SsuD/methylene tetrahydromethanopterin reductase-like flavin-dependent oxidoreductase (luciferase family)